MKIYHNPRCTKSRETLQLIQDAGKKVEIIEYLNNPPTPEELKKVIGLLGIKPANLLRKGEAIFKENYKGKNFSDDEWINIMIENPKLIERPIVIEDGKAVIGRPPERVLELM